MARTYLAVTEWRGKLHISPMRCFSTLKQANEYLDTDPGIDPSDEARVYLVSSDQPPKLVRKGTTRKGEGRY